MWYTLYITQKILGVYYILHFSNNIICLGPQKITPVNLPLLHTAQSRTVELEYTEDTSQVFETNHNVHSGSCKIWGLDATLLNVFALPLSGNLYMQMLQLMWLCQPPCLLPKQHKPLVLRLVVSLDQRNQCTCLALSLTIATQSHSCGSVGIMLSTHSAHELPSNTLLPLVHPRLQTLACTLGSSPCVDLLEIIHCSWDLYTHNCSMFSNWNIFEVSLLFTKAQLVLVSVYAFCIQPCSSSLLSTWEPSFTLLTLP